MTFVVSPSITSSTFDSSLRFARIGYENFVRGSTVTPSTEEAGFPGDSITRATTWERWRPTSMALPQTIEIDIGERLSASYVGIAAHTLGTTGSTIQVQYWAVVTESWENLVTISPEDDSSIMAVFEPQIAREWRLRITGDNIFSLGVVYLGRVLTMQRPIYGGHSPSALSRNTTVRPNRSTKGQWLGRSIIREGASTTYNWEHLGSRWYRNHFDPFVEAAREYPFFVAWRPDLFPDEVAYCWANDDIQPSNMGIRDLMEVSVPVEVFKG